MRLVSLASPSPARAAFSGPHVTPAGALRFAAALLVVANLGAVPTFSLGNRSAPLFLNDVLVFFALFVGGVAIARARSLQLDKVALAALAFAGIGALSAVGSMPRYGLTVFEVLASLAYLARWLMYFGIYLVILNCVKERDVSGIWKALEGTMLVFAGFGIFQAAFLPDFGQMIYPESKLYLEIDPQGHRLMSTILEPNIAAAMILTVLLVYIAQLAMGATVARWKPALLLVALVLTISRSGALAFLVGVFTIFAVRGLGRKMVRFLGVMLVALIASLPPLLRFASTYQKLGISDVSAAARFIVWQRSIATFLDNPWFGIGFNTYGFVQERNGIERYGSATYSAEGGLLFIAVMTGIVGLAVYGVMLWLQYRRCRSVWRNRLATPDERGFCLGAAAATVAILVHSVFVNTLLTTWVMEPLWILWGITFLVARTVRQRHALT
ncbi:MAG TPA: O-antigen ligase family protein [Gemmatimonadaceae bacterium]|nr:O-antigen ligase family protein [Gemmatimonadaceae bacterium]